MHDKGDAVRPSPNSYWVKPGRFAAGEYPGAVDDAEAATKLRELLDAGINHFIDLTEAGELRPYSQILQKEARSVGLEVGWERHSIKDVSVPRSAKEMADTLDAIDLALEMGRAVYLHCWGGVGRTGTVVGCWLVRHGLTGEAALGEIAELWQEVEKSHLKPNSPETQEQMMYIRNWNEQI